MTDQEILSSVQENQRFAQDPGLGDFFDDIGGAVDSTWKKLVGTASNEAENRVTEEVKKAFGTEEQGTQTPDDVMDQVTPPTTEKTFIQKIPPIVVGAGTTALAKFVGKFGWVTSIAAGAVVGGAKYFFIDKKQGA